MLRMLTRGSQMTQLYLEYLKQRNSQGGEGSAANAVLASIKSLIAEKRSGGAAVSTLSQKKRFERYQKSLGALGNSVDPSVGA